MKKIVKLLFGSAILSYALSTIAMDGNELSSNVFRPSIGLHSPCGDIYVRFCDLECSTHPQAELDLMFRSVLIYTNNIQEIAGISLKRFHDSQAYYYCLDAEENYLNLEQYLEGYEEGIDPSFLADEEQEGVCSNPGECQTSTLDVLVNQILDANTVCFSFGAGFSAGYVPTLLDFFKDWGLEKITSKDSPTKESLIRFAGRLMKSSKEVLEMVRKDYTKVFSLNVESTPAHLALKNLIDVLKDNGKAVYIYTDNKDGIHQKVGIQESIKPIDHQIWRVDLPELAQKKVAAVVCGQSFDFNFNLSTLYTRRHDAQNVSFFSLNIQSNNIAIMDGYDSDKMYDQYFSQGNNAPPIKYNSVIEGMLHIPGSIQTTLPTLYDLTTNALKK